jgi:hypothetical protein
MRETKPPGSSASARARPVLDNGGRAKLLDAIGHEPTEDVGIAAGREWNDRLDCARRPWRFTVSEDEITIVPDLNRSCPAIDPDDHHLFASLGCAAENVVQVAPMLGFKADLHADPIPRDRLVIALERIPPSRNTLALAIDRRQCTRSVYDGRAASAEDLRSLQ